jgi:hypothetical protein
MCCYSSAIWAARGSDDALAIDRAQGRAHAVAYDDANLGSVLHEAGRFPEAEAAYRQALAGYDPGALAYVASAQRGLGNVLVDLGRLDEAQACWRPQGRAGSSRRVIGLRNARGRPRVGRPHGVGSGVMQTRQAAHGSADQLERSRITRIFRYGARCVRWSSIRDGRAGAPKSIE